MPKASTSEVQHSIRDMGAKLGFHSEIEVQFPTLRGAYCPRFDVVWFLEPPPTVKALADKGLFPKTKWLDYFRRIPIAAFEIEGSTTTSKNQVGNFANLFFSPCMYNFAIVINSQASNENDTYRRGIKIYRTFRHTSGDKNIVFMDWSQLSRVKPTGSTSPRFNTSRSYKARTKGSGGETGASVDTIAKLAKTLADAGLFVMYDSKPVQLQWAYSQVQRHQELSRTKNDEIACGRTAIWDPETGERRRINKSEDYFYTPKLDTLGGFYLPLAFTSFLVEAAGHCGPDSYTYPLFNYVLSHTDDELFFPFVAIEVESGTTKHLNGGIMNMAAFSFLGLLVSPAEGRKHLQTIKEHSSVGNVFHKEISAV